MLEAHWKEANHLSVATTYRQSLHTIFTIRGRDLAQEVRDSCNYCKRYKARMVEVEMGRIHESRLTIAPPFTYCQVDLLGPYEARCEHNHRSVVKVWSRIQLSEPYSSMQWQSAILPPSFRRIHALRPGSAILKNYTLMRGHNC